MNFGKKKGGGSNHSSELPPDLLLTKMYTSVWGFRAHLCDRALMTDVYPEEDAVLSGYQNHDNKLGTESNDLSALIPLWVLRAKGESPALKNIRISRIKK